MTVLKLQEASTTLVQRIHQRLFLIVIIAPISQDHEIVTVETLLVKPATGLDTLGAAGALVSGVLVSTVKVVLADELSFPDASVEVILNVCDQSVNHHKSHE
jgi:hypothetical protein